MCGIVGFLDTTQQEPVLEAMLKTLHHRGPDDSGTYCDDTASSFIHLAHARLSILDLSEQGHQPFLSEDGNYVIVYNGEVYNFNDIKNELIALGYAFRSTSDTEVILYAFKEWGVKAVDRFIGMFAFAIYDKSKKKLFLFRDRAGVKPLYYYHDDDIFLFSSELKSFLKHPKFHKVINKEILPFYFQFGYIPEPHTIYQNTHKLQAAHYMEVDIVSNTFEIVKYWDVTDFYVMEKFQKSEEEILRELEALLTDAFNLRMISDVPVGIFLSGGYDSSLVTAILQKTSPIQLNTFTIGFEDKELNEADHAKAIAAYLGTNHTEYYCNEDDLLSLVKELPYYYDEPFADDSAIATMLLSKLSREHVTVALSADGGDETFFGYSKYFAIEQLQQMTNWRFRLLKTGGSLLSERFVKKVNALLPASIKQTNVIDKFIKFKRVINATSPYDMFIQASSYVDPKFLEATLKNGAFKKFETTNFSKFSCLKGITSGDMMMAIDYGTFMVDDVLSKVDRATMSISLEGREPLLDHRIIEYLARIPLDIKYKHNQGKYLSRTILYNYLPSSLVDKPKSGFTIPLKQWLEGRLNALALRCLKSDILLEDNLFHTDKLERLVDDLSKKKVKEPTFIWMVIVYVMWREQWK